MNLDRLVAAATTGTEVEMPDVGTYGAVLIKIEEAEKPIYVGGVKKDEVDPAILLTFKGGKLKYNGEVRTDEVARAIKFSFSEKSTLCKWLMAMDPSGYAMTKTFKDPKTRAEAIIELLETLSGRQWIISIVEGENTDKTRYIASVSAMLDDASDKVYPTLVTKYKSLEDQGKQSTYVAPENNPYAEPKGYNVTAPTTVSELANPNTAGGAEVLTDEDIPFN